MATVITNLLSAIPVFGKDLVESELNMYAPPAKAGEGINKGIVIESIKILKNNDSIYVGTMGALTTIGTVNVNALKKGRRRKRTDKKEYLSIPSEFIAFFVGLIDGGGYIGVNQTTKGYISLKLVLILNIEDLSALEYIHSIFKFGKITKYKDNKHPICKLVINRTDLQEVVFPLLLHYNIFFLTNSRKEQFDLALYILKNEIKMYKEIPSSRSALEAKDQYYIFPQEASQYIDLPFFKN